MEPPVVACVNHASVPLGVDFGRLVRTLGKFVDRHFGPACGLAAKVIEARAVPRGAYGLVFLDDADTGGFLGYHDVTAHGFPLGKVFVKTTLAQNESVSVTASHELAELLVDPGMNLRCSGPHDRTYTYEAADAVEEESFEINGVEMSDFVHPSWFEPFHKPRSVQFDHLGLVEKPFQLLPGGYIQVCEFGHKVWTTLHGSKQKAKRHALEDRRGHRSELRAARDRGEPLRKSRR